MQDRAAAAKIHDGRAAPSPFAAPTQRLRGRGLAPRQGVRVRDRSRAGRRGVAGLATASASLLSAILCLSCATQRHSDDGAREALLAEDHSTPRPTAQTERSEPASALPFGVLDAGVQATTERILNGVAATRGLAIKSTVHVGKASRPELLEFIQKEIHRQVPQSHFEQMGRLQIAFGVMPLGADPERVMLSMFAEGVQGLYDPASKSFLIGDDVPTGMREMVVGHEIVHALQDMHFDLEKMQDPIIGHSDQESARTFLIEGDAQASYYAWAARGQGLEALTPQLLGDIADQSLGIDRSSSEFPFLAKLTIMPYTEGAATIVELARARGWTSVDALFERLPTTTEQMMHLDKLLAFEPANEITLPAAAFQDAVPGLRAVYEDDLGEAFLLALMSSAHGVDNARRFAAGWGGDRFTVLEPQDQAPSYARPSVVVGIIQFDTERDATEAAPALERSLREVAPAGALTSRHKSTVLYVLNSGNAPKQAEALMGAMIQGARIDGKAIARKGQR